MSNEAKAWTAAFAWALVALLRGIQVGSAVGIFSAAIGVIFAGFLVAVTWRNEDREERSRER